MKKIAKLASDLSSLHWLFEMASEIRNLKRKAGMPLNAPCIFCSGLIDFEIIESIKAEKDFVYSLHIKRWVIYPENSPYSWERVILAI